MQPIKTTKGWLFILPWSPEAIGGINRVVIELCQAINHEGKYQPIILVLDWSADEPFITEKPGYIEIHYRLRSPEKDLKTILGFILSLPKTLISLANLLKRYHVTVVNPHNPTSSIIHFIFLRLLTFNFKLLISIHGADLKGIADSKDMNKRLWKWIIGYTDVIVACSKGLADNFTALFPEAGAKVKHIHNGVSSDFLTPKSNTVNIDFLPQKYLLSVGTFEHKKGHDILISAFAVVAKQFPDLSLVLVGRSNDTLAKYKQQAFHLGIESRIFFFENISPDRIIDFYRQASLYVSPSRDEPFGIVMLEAGALGIPVLATKTLGALEIIEDGLEGKLVSIGDVDALAHEISNLLSDNHKCKIYADALKAKIVSKFTWENALMEYMSLIN